jgi:hypothetical protein
MLDSSRADRFWSSVPNVCDLSSRQFHSVDGQLSQIVVELNLGSFEYLVSVNSDVVKTGRGESCYQIVSGRVATIRQD